MSLEPAWVVAAVAAGGVVFQGGVGWATLQSVKKQQEKIETHDKDLARIDKRVDHHEWVITSHGNMLNEHGQHIEKLREAVK